MPYMEYLKERESDYSGGCGGNRDKGKRPIMAKEAAKASDRVIITSDNPRFEEPQDIINDMLAGLDAEDMKKTLSIADRKEAIRTACMLAEKRRCDSRCRKRTRELPRDKRSKTSF